MLVAIETSFLVDHAMDSPYAADTSVGIERSVEIDVDVGKGLDWGHLSLQLEQQSRLLERQVNV